MSHLRLGIVSNGSARQETISGSDISKNVAGQIDLTGENAGLSGFLFFLILCPAS